MKTTKTLGLAMLLASAFAIGSANAAIGSIAGSKHDFSSTGSSLYKGTSNQTCVFCHTPHNANSSTVALWNHAPTTATFTLYSSPTMNSVTAQPAGVSKLCLSCHDGTVAVDSYGTNIGTQFTLGVTNLGTDLSNDHPIGMTYDPVADPALRATTAAATIGTGNTGTIATKLLYANKVECPSCHDVHNSTLGTAQESKLLRISNSGSALCLACHIK